ncbi:MAG: hypothetical protein EB101_10135 [Chitinophagia bacterium]|nr:hypothetical protein [Chitinophagia bacterium]
MQFVPTAGNSGRPNAVGWPCSAFVTTLPMVRPRNPPVPKANVRKNRSFSSAHSPADTSSPMLASTKGEDFEAAADFRIFSAESAESFPAFTACSSASLQPFTITNHFIPGSRWRRVSEIMRHHTVRIAYLDFAA